MASSLAVWEATVAGAKVAGAKVAEAKVAEAKQVVVAPADQLVAAVVLQLTMGTPKAEVQL